ncbi:MAG: DUF3048 domain-containing protein [Saccharopolyspora sp.]|uniref:DUF3048 domain-containing protein n=1 Tax=Saccharopolyspora sp. TaxID=33915 RepID=UPI0025CF266B|nr:DUF3048 domain-containing protein [Saccharopolyspora sp.]MBQ6643102.1 DUF3048 domain-containing protein [Saccharopolyspora sp.]
MRRTFSSVVRAFAVLVAVFVVGLACQPTRTQPAPPPPQPAQPQQPAPAPPGPPAPGPPVLAVKIDNVPEARPAVGIGSADLVVVEPVEGGLSRLVAVFGGDRPPVVGPVRSARETDMELLAQFGRPTLVFSGAAPQLLPRLSGAALDPVPLERDPSAFFRGTDRESPHNLFVRPSAVPAGAPWSPKAPMVFGPAPAGGQPRESAQVAYKSASTSFTWSPQQQRYLVGMDGKPAAAADSGRLGAGTVVLQEVAIHQSSVSDVAGSASPYAESVGSGRALVLRDGMAFDARWNRPSPDVGTTYTTESGDPLPFAPGPVWVALTGKL